MVTFSCASKGKSPARRMRAEKRMDASKKNQKEDQEHPLTPALSPNDRTVEGEGIMEGRVR